MINWSGGFAYDFCSLHLLSFPGSFPFLLSLRCVPVVPARQTAVVCFTGVGSFIDSVQLLLPKGPVSVYICKWRDEVESAEMLQGSSKYYPASKPPTLKVVVEGCKVVYLFCIAKVHMIGKDPQPHTQQPPPPSLPRPTASLEEGGGLLGGKSRSRNVFPTLLPSTPKLSLQTATTTPILPLRAPHPPAPPPRPAFLLL